jgi:hypothetical protein
VAVPLMVRLEDDLHAKLTEQSRRTHAPMNRIVNDALRLMFSGAIGGNSTSRSGGSHIVATFDERKRQAEAAVVALEGVPQENLRDLQRTSANAMRLLLDCITAAMFAIDPSLTPVIPPATSHESNTKQQEVRA